ncbi:class F sortase [Guptibacillus spartinae]|uniref:class F sortase n=1 Tax=Guptibacillus spartinae TaxID=3025679 RepID=UPI00235EB8B4|nr:sortase [Pseudalkalibacillus spartinae]
MRKILLLVVGAIIWLVLAGYNNYVEPETVQELETNSSEETQSNIDVEEMEKPDVLSDEFLLLDDQKEKIEKAKASQDVQEGIEPVQLEIPAIDVTAEIENVGVLDNGQMGVPEDINKVGWFEPGFKPGTKGNAVLAGHVDSKTGPAIFFYLEKLSKGDEIILTGQDGETMTFVVTGKERYPYNDSPIEKIFGPTDSRTLNLITCVGTFNRSKGTHEERLVVSTELKEENLDKKEEVNPDEVPDAPTNLSVSGNFLSWHAVRDENVVGYRIYKADAYGVYKQIESVSNLERKSFADPDASSSSYYVTTVNIFGNESAPSKKITPEE